MPHTTIMIDGDGGDDEKKESGEDMPGVEAGNYDLPEDIGARIGETHPDDHVGQL